MVSDYLLSVYAFTFIGTALVFFVWWKWGRHWWKKIRNLIRWSKFVKKLFNL